MKKIYLVQMEEVINNNDCMETIDVWEDFYDYTDNLDEAKANALKLLNDIKKHKVSEIFEVSDPNNHIGVCISVYKEEDNSILDVIEIGDLTPNEWNITCGSCGAYCSEGTCFKYGDRVDEDTIASDCWHSL